MAYIDTHKAYKELIESGIPIEQAEAQVALLNNSLDNLVTKEYLSTSLKIFETDLKFFFTNEIVALAVAVIIIPFIANKITKKFGWE